MLTVVSLLLYLCPAEASRIYKKENKMIYEFIDCRHNVTVGFFKFFVFITLHLVVGPSFLSISCVDFRVQVYLSCMMSNMQIEKWP